jgi:hypothetical protein
LEELAIEDVGKFNGPLVYLRPFVKFFGYLVYFLPVLVCCTKKNLATLVGSFIETATDSTFLQLDFLDGCRWMHFSGKR